jgi:rhodanese-related sulfurtransferase
MPGEPPLPAPDWAAIDAWLDLAYPDVPSLDVDALARRLDDPARPAPRLLDARAAVEFDLGTLPGAVHAPTPRAALDALAGAPHGAGVVVFCSVGVRSARLARALRAHGIEDVHNLRGSVFAWANRGLPLADARGPVARVHPFDASWGQLLDPSRRAPT